LKNSVEELSSRLSFQLEGRLIEPIVVISPKRKTVALEIKQGQVHLRIPKQVDTRWLIRFIEQRTSWIAKHLALQQSYSDEHAPNPYLKKSCLYMGVEYPVEWQIWSGKSQVVFDGHYFLVCINQRTRRTLDQLVNEQLRLWIKERASISLIQRTHELTKVVGKVPTEVVLSNHKTMWGRCSAKGEVALNWRLMLAKPEAIDYVIIHELCHLWEFNHSPAFWQKVSGYCADFERYKQYFKHRSSWLHWR
jgi:hypothetical protein